MCDLNGEYSNIRLGGVCKMTYSDENLGVILRYIPEELLFEICKLKKINNLGVRCSKIEEVRKNRESLSQNLLKPINKNHFSKWLFAYFSKVKKKELDLNGEDLPVKGVFDLLIIAMFNNDTESFDVYTDKLKSFFNKESERVENNTNEIEKPEQVNSDNKILKKLEQKLNSLQLEIKDKDDKYNIQKASLQEKIIFLNNELKEMQRKISISNNEKIQIETEKNDFKNNLNKLVNIKNDLEFQNSNLIDTINELQIKLNEAFKKNIKVVGVFNLNLITNPNIKIEFLSIEEFLSLSVINQELWMLQFALTPREKYKLESSMKEKEILNKVVKINSNSELLTLINTGYSVPMEVF